MSEQTPRQRLQETLRRNAEAVSALPEWARRAVSTDEVFLSGAVVGTAAQQRELARRVWPDDWGKLPADARGARNVYAKV